MTNRPKGHSRERFPSQNLLFGAIKISIWVGVKSVEADKYVLISPTFDEQLLRLNPFAKKLQTQIVSTQKLRKKHLYENAARKILVKFTLGLCLK